MIVPKLHEKKNADASAVDLGAQFLTQLLTNRVSMVHSKQSLNT